MHGAARCPWRWRHGTGEAPATAVTRHDSRRKIWSSAGASRSSVLVRCVAVRRMSAMETQRRGVGSSRRGYERQTQQDCSFTSSSISWTRTDRHTESNAHPPVGSARPSVRSSVVCRRTFSGRHGAGARSGAGLSQRRRGGGAGLCADCLPSTATRRRKEAPTAIRRRKEAPTTISEAAEE